MKPFPPLSKRLDTLTPFQAVEVYQQALQLEAQGKSIYHLEFGEPDFPTPQVISEAGEKAIQAGHTRYTHSMGLPEFREVIAQHYQQRYGVEVHPDQILVSMGTSIITELVMLALLDEGDEVILPDPSYACYANFITIAGGKPVYVRVREENGFQLDPDEVKAAITPRTKAIMVVSPGNPTGAVLKPEVMKALAETGLPIISDEIYHGLTYSGEEHTALEYTDRALVLNGFSKYFAMTGWRLGYLIFPKHMNSAFRRLHGNVVISATDFVQHAGMAAMLHATEACEGFKAEYDKRRQFMVQRLAEIGLPLKYEPTGAFYCFANASQYDANSMRLATRILQETGVALTPGSDFGPGGEGYLRFSYANSMENLTEAMNRLEGFFKGFKAQ